MSIWKVLKIDSDSRIYDSVLLSQLLFGHFLISTEFLTSKHGGEMFTGIFCKFVSEDITPSPSSWVDQGSNVH